MKLTGLGASMVMLGWAICYPMITLSAHYAPIMLTATLRALYAGVLLIVVAVLFKRPVPKTLRDFVYILAIGLTATSLGFWGMFYAGTLVAPGLATVISNSQPLIAAVLGWYVLNERMSKSAVAGAIFGFSGIVVISVDTLLGTSHSLLGIAYILMAALGVAISNILLKLVATKIDVLYAMGFQLVLGSIPLGLMTLIQNQQSAQWSGEFLWILLILTLPGTALPLILWFWLMDKAPLYKLNVFSFLTPIFGLAIGYTYFSESFSLNQWVGIGLIMASIMLVTAPTTRSRGTKYKKTNQSIQP